MGNTWNPPPPRVQEEVERIVGFPIYKEAAARFARVAREDPGLVLKSWYRARPVPGQAQFSQHPLALAVDVGTSSAQRRAALVQAAQREGFWTKVYRTHVHIQALRPQEFQRFLPQFRASGLYR